MNINGRPTNPGELRTPVTLQKRTTATANSGGFIVPTYPTEYTVWAKWQNHHGNEVYDAQAAGLKEGATLTIRYRSDLDVTWRVVKGGLVYEIVSMDNILERNEYIELQVKRVRAG